MSAQEAVVDIVLVEDDPSDADLIVRALTRAGLACAVRVLEDGAEALAYFFGTGADVPGRPTVLPRVVLLNLHLPKVSGLEVLGRLKADPQTRTIPVVMLTSSRAVEDVSRSYQLGVNSYVVKPVEFTHFREEIAQITRYWLLMNQLPVPPEAHTAS